MKKFVRRSSILIIILLSMILVVACTPKVKLGDTELSLKKGELNITDSKSGESVSVKEGKVEFTDEEGKSTVKVDEEGNVEVTDDEGNAVMQMSDEGGLDVPKDYPSDILPLMKDSNIVMAARDDAEEGLGFSLLLEIEREPQEVYEFYKKAMEDAQEPFKMEMDGSYTLGGILQDYSVSIIIGEGDIEGSTSVTLVLEKDE